MSLLLDTRILLWATSEPERLSEATRSLFENPDNELVFSAVSLWEIAIKTGRGRDGFPLDAGSLRRSLIDNGYAELPTTGAHTAAPAGLSAIHKDPFDRMLVAQATVEGLTLATSDTAVASYPGPIRRV
jgi:PIN domain nuclease of toxin-antitoxin system